MKVAFVSFLNSVGTVKVPGGATTGPLYFQQILKKYFGQDMDIISINQNQKGSWIDGRNYLYPQNVVPVLNEYDFIIFGTPGHWYNKDPEGVRWYNCCLEGLAKPFALIINEERDYEIFTCMWEFTSHPMYRVLLLNSEGMAENFKDIIFDYVTPIEFQYFVPLDDIDTIIGRSRELYKGNSIISTSRWTDRKRQKELIEISDKLADKGISTYIIGESSSFFYTKKMNAAMEKVSKRDLHIGTGYIFNELPELLKPHKFHYNFVYTLKKTKNRVMRPRLEIATYEAYNQGLLPVICADTTPEWASNGTVRIESTELEYLADILEPYTHNDNALECKLRQFYDDTMNICLDKFGRFYGKMMEIVYGS